MNPLQNPQIPEPLREEMLEELAVIAMEAPEDGSDGAHPDAEAVAMAVWIRRQVLHEEAGGQ